MRAVGRAVRARAAAAFAAIAAATLATLTACTGPGNANVGTPSALAASGAAPSPGPPPLQTQARRSSFADMSAATQAMQLDDAANPAFLWVEEGRQRFAAACARCHTESGMAGVAARYPAWDTNAERALTLGQRISSCHQRHAGGEALPPQSDMRIALEAFIALQSRGQPWAPSNATGLAPWRERGRTLFEQRLGQLDLSCAQCHDQLAGRRLAGSVIPQGHPTGYPIYRLEWQAMGGLQRRLRGCLQGVRAEPFGWDSEEMTALEVFLAARAAGMRLEAPAVRP